MASRELKVEIIGDASSLNKALGSVSKSSGTLGTSLSKMGKLAAVGLGALGVGAVVAGKKMIGLASDAAEVDSKLEVTFGKTLPGLTKEIDKFSEATGASRFELREQAADMGALLVPLTATKKGAADMSMQVVQLATDLGSFNNVPVEEALLAIRSGLVGEAEPLRRFGVLLNAAAVETEGVRLGLAKTGKEMTEQDKVQARYSLVMKQTSLAQGDATRTAGSMSNQVKALKNNVKDMATSAGQMLIPFALTAVKSFNKVLGAVDGFVKKLSEAKGIKAKLNIVWTGIKDIAQGFINTFDKYFVSGWTTYSGGGMGRTVETFHEGLLRRLQNLNWGDIGQRILDGIVQGMKDAKKLAERLAKVIDEAMAAVDWAAAGQKLGPGFLTMLATAFTLLMDPGFWAAHWELALGVALTAAGGPIAKLAKGFAGTLALKVAGAVEELLGPAAGRAVLASLMKVGTVIAGAFGVLGGAIRSLFGKLGGLAVFTIKVLGIAAALSAIQQFGRLVGTALANAARAVAGFATTVARILADAARTAAAAAVAIGDAIIRGILNGLRDLVSKVGNALKGIGVAIIAAAFQAGSLAVGIGSAIVSGIIAGLGNLVAKVGGAIKDGVSGAVSWAGSKLPGSGPFMFTIHRIGEPMGEGVGIGFKKAMGNAGDVMNSALNTAVTNLAKTVTTARGTLAAAFRTVFSEAAQAGLDAIDARFANWKPPSLVLADKEAAKKTWDDLTLAINNAEKALIEADKANTDAIANVSRLQGIAAQLASGIDIGAVTGLTDEEKKAMLGMTPEEAKAYIAERTTAAVDAANTAAKTLADAYKALEDAEFARRQEYLRRQGAQEQTAHDKLVAGLKKLFLDRLAEIRKAQKNEPPEWRKLHQKLLDLYDEFGIELGAKFGKSIKNGLIAVGSAVDELATAIANKIAGREGGGGKGEKGKARGGPVFKGGRYIVGEKGPEMFVPKQSGSIMTASQTRRFLRGGGSGGLTKSGKGVSQGESVPMAPKWANESVWQAAVAIAGSMGKLEEFIGAVNSGSYRANAGLLNGIAQNRTRWNWNVLDGWPSVRDAIDMMLPLGQGMSGAEAAEFFGWMKKGGTLPGDGLYYGHKGETVIPLDRSMGQTVIINVTGYVGSERQLARELAPAFMEETRKRQGKGAPPITRVR